MMGQESGGGRQTWQEANTYSYCFKIKVIEMKQKNPHQDNFRNKGTREFLSAVMNHLRLEKRKGFI